MCGLVHSTLVMVPCNSNVWLTSNSPAREWCARAVPAAKGVARAATRLSTFLLPAAFITSLGEKKKINVPMNRRDFIHRAACWTGAALPLSKSGLVIAQAGKGDLPVSAQRLSRNVLLVSGPDSNALVVDSSEGLILVDGGHADHY